MTATISGDAPRDAERAKLRVAVYDALAKAKGYRTVEAQAAWHDMNRATLFNLRSGATAPMLTTAMRMASDLGVAVEVIWEWERVAA